ncbi:TonB-dependent receptor [Chitinophaga nivalis]|uniref:TonB-dependent receptor n=1 Tax=Chitinophaga nivalis TaxID=2991709 RepID=A0ABT3IP86_9BACT|nr:TonB-dependent receptor [Chitinophaga nivalis]MCW3464551.1 TonB-dependent receptor [Chitinophaga nivalis]MCW3485758.1 TonB-dependent receptor [Chitinophaga nivalis]
MKNTMVSFGWPLLCILCCSQLAVAQYKITGTVKNSKGEAITGASITLPATGGGTTADVSGAFALETGAHGKQQLSVSAIGYRSFKQTILLADTTLVLAIVLPSDPRALQEVVVNAGTFEASDKAKGAALTPIDAVTVAGSYADITQALRSLPGAQQIGEQEGLFVRGGTSDETKQFIDGTLLKYPNYPSVPGITQYARVNPFLFKGILFSSGGYSALYGSAMSSALILESVDLPEKTSASFSIFPANLGAGWQHLARNNRSSYGVNLSYSNQALYNKIIPQQPDYFSGPRYLDGTANFRLKTGRRGMLKFYTNWSSSDVGTKNPDIDSLALRAAWQVKGQNIYNNLSYRSYLADNWKIEAGAAYTYNQNEENTSLQTTAGQRVVLPTVPYAGKNRATGTQTHFAQARLVLTHFFPAGPVLRWGAEHFYTREKSVSNDSAKGFTDQLTAVFAEADIYLTRRLAAKAGVRMEYAALLRQAVTAPRISLAYRLPHGGQFNLAYGIFYQQPAAEWLYKPELPAFSAATHYILNYTQRFSNRFFRVEAYYKQYANLVKTTPALSNNGNGYAQGIELFWRDKKSIRDLDYWVTYTYLDTKRDFADYPYSLRPAFAAPHTATVAVKKFFRAISTNVNVSYALAAGRPYYDIRYDAPGHTYVADEGTTKGYSVVNLHVAYLTSFFKHWKRKDFSGIALGVNNLLGTEQVFGYRYSVNGQNKVPVTLPATRSFFVGVFISLGIDRTDDFLNNNL